MRKWSPDAVNSVQAAEASDNGMRFVSRATFIGRRISRLEGQDRCIMRGVLRPRPLSLLGFVLQCPQTIRHDGATFPGGWAVPNVNIVTDSSSLVMNVDDGQSDDINWPAHERIPMCASCRCERRALKPLESQPQMGLEVGARRACGHMRTHHLRVLRFRDEEVSWSLYGYR